MSLELSEKLSKTFAKMKIEGSDCVFTWVPRTGSAISENGFDQGREISGRIAKRYGAEHYPLFSRVGGKEQKKLDRKNRKKNVVASIKLNESMRDFPRFQYNKSINDFVKGKRVVIIDDVMTSGATLRRASELLHSAGVESSIVACVAKSVTIKQKSKD
jgi:predicted amidophosphoribosyltransferase